MKLWRLGVVFLCQGLVAVACNSATRPAGVTSEPGVDSGVVTRHDSGGGGGQDAAGTDTGGSSDAIGIDGATGQDGGTAADTGATGFDVFTGFDAAQPDCPDTGCFVPPPMDAAIPDVNEDALNLPDGQLAGQE